MIKLHPIFRLREEVTEEILELLSSVTLGTNGAHYRHLDNDKRIKEADKPLYLSMERNDRVLGNVTFCRREKDWYIRYFAFSSKFQSTGVRKSKSQKSNLLKTELESFFQQSLEGGYDGKEIRSHYAYIDPNNEKSLWMSENFGFETIAEIATQTFSRTSPKKSDRIERTENWDDVSEVVQREFGDYNLFYDMHVQRPPFYSIRNAEGEIIALTKTSIASWEIKRLPGRFGGLLTKIIPWIPGIRKIIRPKKHSFVVPEAVYVKDNDPELLKELFEGILAHEKLNLILWWVDNKAPIYSSVKDKLKWGILHIMVGVSNANLVVRKNKSTYNIDESTPFYTIGFDFI